MLPERAKIPYRTIKNRVTLKYEYKYTDQFGSLKTVRSWRLTKADSVPPGRRSSLSLREMERDIQANLAKGIGNKDLTVLELVDRYLKTLTGLKHNTVANHRTVRNLLAKEVFGQCKIDKVKMSDAKLFLIKLQSEDGKGYSSIHSIRGVLRPAFQMAVDDDMIVKNPFEFQLAGVIVNDNVTREAISRSDERRFLEFVKNDKHYSRYYDAIFILFNTGMRISEFCGLTISDIDLSNNEIHIDHQLQRMRNMEYVIESTKTNAGTRIIPMENGVADAFRRIIENRKKPKAEPMIDGYAGFLFLDKNEMPMVALHWEKYFQAICNKYNKIYRLQMPKVTPHVCRHTYCSNKAKSGMNPKVLQYLMGHSDIGVTLNTYTHLGHLDAKNEMDRLSQANSSDARKPLNSGKKRVKMA